MSIIKEYRLAKGLTQPALSVLVGVSLGMVKRWEAKSYVPTLLKGARLCKVLKLPMSKLINDYKEVK
jgi:transcriptional regulator with XRE-family HTH domain